MKKFSLFILTGLILIFSILACGVTINDNWEGQTVHGSGAAGEENRNVSNVTGIELAMQGTLYFTKGNSESLRIEADDNLLQYIQTDVRAGRLVIESRPGINLQTVRPIKYYLTVVRLDSIVISSSGDVETEDLRSDSFSATINSSGNLSIGRLDCTALYVKISSSGDVKISTLAAKSISVDISSSGNLDVGGGQVQQQTITISSSGEYRAEDLTSVDAEVTLTSSGEAIIRVSDRLSGRLSSSGNINYIGSPEVNVDMSSSGKAVQIGK
jgi:hypothetical protein